MVTSGDSGNPLEGQVVFIEGAPRSGTSWLGAMLGTHPEVASILNESHLFNYGLDRVFNNYEDVDPARVFLSGYVSRTELVRLCRSFCDGVLGAMRQHVNPSARYVLEKTPIGPDDPTAQVARKLDCYPDAWYLHIVRDGRAVTRSLMAAAFNPDPSPEASHRWWQESVAAIREGLAGHPRYREVQYEELVERPLELVGDIFDWLGLERSEATMAAVAATVDTQYADHSVGASDEGRLGPLAFARLQAMALGRRGRRRLRALIRAESPTPLEVVTQLVHAAHEGDADALERLSAADMELELAAGGSTLTVTGSEARAALLSALAHLISRGLHSERWVASRGEPFATALLIGKTVDGDRVGVSFSGEVRGGEVARLIVVSTAPVVAEPAAGSTAEQARGVA